MNLRESTRDIISQVKSLTRCPVEVVEDDTLQTEVGFECALLGRRGRSLIKSEPTYTLHSLPGEYSSPPMVSIMHASYQQIAPGTDLGMDLAREYEMAQGMKG